MKYKESSRSPSYGKIFAYDKNGREIQELDVLRLVLVHNKREYKVQELFEKTLENEVELARLKASEARLIKSQKSLKNQNDNLYEALRILNAKVRKLESDKNLF